MNSEDTKETEAAEGILSGENSSNVNDNSNIGVMNAIYTGAKKKKRKKKGRKHRQPKTPPKSSNNEISKKQNGKSKKKKSSKNVVIDPVSLNHALSHVGVYRILELDYNYNNVNQDQFDNDLKIIVGAEMDAQDKKTHEIVEIKCSVYKDYSHAIWNMHPSKVFNIWAQCYFSGIDSCIIGYRNRQQTEKDFSIINKIERFHMDQTENMLSDRSKSNEAARIVLEMIDKCKFYVPFILNWLKNQMENMNSDTLYVLQMDIQPRKQKLSYRLRLMKDQTGFQEVFQTRSSKFGMMVNSIGDVVFENVGYTV